MKAIAVGIGNSTLRIAEMEEMEVCRSIVLPHEAIRTGAAAAFLRERNDPLPGIAGICSVVPVQTGAVEALLRAEGVADVRHCIPSAGVEFSTRYRSMETLGADRFCAVLAAKSLYGSPVIVIDCGTATTVNVVDTAGVFLGGSIGVGVSTSFAALHERTALLPDASAQRGAEDTRLIGEDTEGSIRSGVLHMHRHALEGMVREIRKRIGPDTPVILTGGNVARLCAAGLVIEGTLRDGDLLLRGVIFFLHLTS